MLVPEAWRNPTSYNDAARIEVVNSHEYKASIIPNYSYGPRAHGGFVQSLLLEVVRLHFATTLASYDQPNTLSFHTEFIRPCAMGGVRVVIKDTRLSKASSTVHVCLSQNGKDCVVGYFTNINHANIQGISIPAYHKPQPELPPVDFARLEEDNSDPNWLAYTVPYRPDAPAPALCNVTFAVQRQPVPDRSVTQHWLACARPDELWTTPKLGLAIDHFVPPIENFFESPHNARSAVKLATQWARHGPPMPPKPAHAWHAPRWYATANMTMEIKRPLPSEGVKWLFCRYKTASTEDGRFDVHCEIWDREFNLIAISQQLWYLLDLSKTPQWQAALKARAGKTGKTAEPSRL